jgi:hypothetical protein
MWKSSARTKDWPVERVNERKRSENQNSGRAPGIIRQADSKASNAKAGSGNPKRTHVEMGAPFSGV